MELGWQSRRFLTHSISFYFIFYKLRRDDGVALKERKKKRSNNLIYERVLKVCLWVWVESCFSFHRNEMSTSGRWVVTHALGK